MKRGTFRAVMAAAAAVAVAATGAAQADTTGTWTPVKDPLGCNDGAQCAKQSEMLPATAGFCPFNVQVKVVENGEMQQTNTLSDGTTVQNVMGTLVMRFQNLSTGKTITRDESGPYTVTTHPDGTGTASYTGNNYFILGPHSRHNTGLPGLIFTIGTSSAAGGLVQITFHTAGPRIIDTFNWAGGTPIDGCALLS